ncbi:hypothetical protein D9M72_585940 [compost metagenome]
MALEIAGGRVLFLAAFTSVYFVPGKLPLNSEGFTSGSTVTNKLSVPDSLFSELTNNETFTGSSLLRLFK